MPGSNDHPSIFASPRAVGLRVADVRRAAEFYQTIGFRFVMAVPDEDERCVLCLLRYGSGSILLAPFDHLRFPLSRRLGPLRRRIELTVPDVGAAYGACAAAGCRVTAEPAREIWGDRTFSCVDPFGYEWRFTQLAEGQGFERRERAAYATWS